MMSGLHVGTAFLEVIRLLVGHKLACDGSKMTGGESYKLLLRLTKDMIEHTAPQITPPALPVRLYRPTIFRESPGRVLLETPKMLKFAFKPMPADSASYLPCI